MTCTLRRFIPNDKIIYTFNMCKEFQDQLALRKDYLDRTPWFKRLAFYTRKLREKYINRKANIFGEALTSLTAGVKICS